MSLKKAQTMPIVVKTYLEKMGYNKAAIARKANLDPDVFYGMLNNSRIMGVDDFKLICEAIPVSWEELVRFGVSENIITSFPIGGDQEM